MNYCDHEEKIPFKNIFSTDINTLRDIIPRIDLDLDLDILSLRKTLHNKESYRKAIIVVNDKTCKIHSKRTQKNLKIREK